MRVAFVYGYEDKYLDNRLAEEVTQKAEAGGSPESRISELERTKPIRCL